MGQDGPLELAMADFLRPRFQEGLAARGPSPQHSRGWEHTFDAR